VIELKRAKKISQYIHTYIHTPIYTHAPMTDRHLAVTVGSEAKNSEPEEDNANIVGAPAGVIRIPGTGEILNMEGDLVEMSHSPWDKPTTHLTGAQKTNLALCFLIALVLAFAPLIHAAVINYFNIESNEHHHVTWVFVIPFLPLCFFFVAWVQAATGCYTALIQAIIACSPSCYPDSIWDYLLIDDLSHIVGLKDIYCGLMLGVKNARNFVILLALDNAFWHLVPTIIFPAIFAVILVDLVLALVGTVYIKKTYGYRHSCMGLFTLITGN